MKGTILSVLIAFLVLCLAQVASAVTIYGDGFAITEFKVKSDDVNPGDSFYVRVEAKNNLTGIDLESVSVNIIVQDMDDGDDFDEDADLNDLDPGDDDSAQIDFTVPYAIDTGNYIIIATVTGESSNGTQYEVQQNSTVTVNKETHALLMKQPVVNQMTLKCSRATDVSTTLYNLGKKDEDVELTVYNTELEINQKQTFTLDSGDSEDDIKATKITSLSLKDVAAGEYTFYVKADYYDNNKQETASFAITVQDCPTATSTTTPAVETSTPAVTTPVQVSTPAVTTLPQATVPAIVEEASFMEQYGSIVLLGLAYIVVIIVGIILVVSLIKKR